MPRKGKRVNKSSAKKQKTNKKNKMTVVRLEIPTDSWDAFRILLRRLNKGKLKDKDGSFVIREITYLIDLDVATNGNLTGHTHTRTKEQIVADVRKMVMDYADIVETIEQRGDPAAQDHIIEVLTAQLNPILDEYNIVDTRSRDNYLAFAVRFNSQVQTLRYKDRERKPPQGYA